MDSVAKELNLEHVPASLVPDSSDMLVRWLRTFWTKLYRDKDFAKYLQTSRAERYAQLYLDVLENARLLDHGKAPVFHRERWYPIVVRENTKNEADATLLELGEPGVILSDGTPPVEGFDDTIRLGTHVDRSATVAYALADDVKAVLSCIVDNIAEPTVILHNGRDFKVEKRSIVLKKSADPFADDSKFPVFDVPESPGEDATREAVLWACDVLIDKNWLFEHVGYAVGLDAESNTRNSALVRAVWDATTDGLNIRHLHRILAAMCCVPCVIEDDEVVDAVYSTGDAKTVVTDKNVYTLGRDANLLDPVRAGNTLHAGDFIDDTVRIYPFVVFADKAKGYSGFDVSRFRNDVSSISIPGALITGDSGNGFYVSWDEKAVVCEGFDSNGNPKLRFSLGMDSDKEDIYWKSVWDKYEKLGTSMSSCFDGLNGGNIEPGSTCGTVIPIKFFLRNLIGANTLIVVVDTDRIPEDAPLYNPNFFHALRKLVPDYVRLYFVEHGTVIDDENGGDDVEDEDEGADVTYAEPEIDDEYAEVEDVVESAKWTRRCRKSARDEDEDD